MVPVVQPSAKRLHQMSKAEDEGNRHRRITDAVDCTTFYLDFGHSSGIAGNVYQPVEFTFRVFGNI